MQTNQSDNSINQIIHKYPLSLEFYSNNYNKHRRNKLIQFMNILSPYEEFINLSLYDKNQLIKKIEASCLNEAIEIANKEKSIINSWNSELFIELYFDICYKISANLGKCYLVNNEFLHKELFSGNIDYKKLANMNSQELFPEKNKDILDKINSSKSITQVIKTSSLYRCHRCKENKCIIENRYNRSLDEGVNLEITCLNCHNKWNA